MVTQKIYEYYWICGAALSRSPHIVSRLSATYIKKILSPTQIDMYIQGDTTIYSAPPQIKETVIGGEERTDEYTSPVVVL